MTRATLYQLAYKALEVDLNIQSDHNVVIRIGCIQAFRSGWTVCVMRDVIQPFTLEGDLQYREIVFDFGTPDKFAKHTRSMKKLPSQASMKTVRGDIWGVFEDEPKGRNRAANQGVPVAYAVNDFFTGLFAGGIEQYVKGSTLWVLACGHTLRELEAFRLFKACITQFVSSSSRSHRFAPTFGIWVVVFSNPTQHSWDKPYSKL
ncbi:hypothetical protein P692DRAFT_20876919 [Suillus brevipes Sb2]|nr:hypothetical protein P692DRAFT_20876919 [Suillus brevipes Sb2]